MLNHQTAEEYYQSWLSLVEQTTNGTITNHDVIESELQILRRTQSELAVAQAILRCSNQITGGAV